jgi:hypothetical protein
MKKMVWTSFLPAFSHLYEPGTGFQSWVNLTFIGGPPGSMNLKTPCVTSVTDAIQATSCSGQFRVFEQISWLSTINCKQVSGRTGDKDFADERVAHAP